MADKTYVILGGGGSFALNTAKWLLAQGDTARVYGVGRAPLRPAAFTLGLEANPRFEYRLYHIWDHRTALMKFLGEVQPDVIINFAAQGEGAASWSYSWRFFHTNAVALSWLYEELEKQAWFRLGVDGKPQGRFIHVGSSEVYGSVTVPSTEDAPIVPTSPYAASKAAFDMYLLALRGQGRAGNVTILRPSNCYGPGQLLHRIVPRAVVCGLTGRKVPLHGGGIARKSYLHIHDLARVIYKLAAYPSRDRYKLRPVYNVGPDEPISIRELCENIVDAIAVSGHDWGGPSFEDLFEVAPERVGQDSCYWLDSSAVKEDLEWRHPISLAEGLGTVVEWAGAHLEVLRDWPQDYELRP